MTTKKGASGSKMITQLHCQCGAVQGSADLRHSYGRAICYCRDCQAFARFLGAPHRVLDAHNGTEILAMLPAAVRFASGAEHLNCVSLSDRGLLRWYASCCHTPIGNTPRDQRIAYVGLIRACIPDLDDSAGPVKIALNTESAKGEVAATPVHTSLGVLRIMKNVIAARMSGKYRDNPFFTKDTGTPAKTPQVLSRVERETLYDRV